MAKTNKRHRCTWTQSDSHALAVTEQRPDKTIWTCPCTYRLEEKPTPYDRLYRR